MSMKNSNDTIWNRNRDLPACSAVPHPTAQNAQEMVFDKITAHVRSISNERRSRNFGFRWKRRASAGIPCSARGVTPLRVCHCGRVLQYWRRVTVTFWQVLTVFMTDRSQYCYEGRLSLCASVYNKWQSGKLGFSGRYKNWVVRTTTAMHVRTALLWVILQRVVVIYGRRFGTTYRYQLQGLWLVVNCAYIL
jgi:hypothetical protein